MFHNIFKSGNNNLFKNINHLESFIKYLIKRQSNSYLSIIKSLIISLLFVYSHTSAADDENITFEDIATKSNSGIDYIRTKSRHHEINELKNLDDILSFNDLFNSPIKSRGAPGVALLDYDRDGDLDIYVTNGPGTGNSLYSNQYMQTENITFIDVASQTNASLTEMDSSGVCFGDIDNDGDSDLYILSAGGNNALLLNKGAGSFQNITQSSRTGGGNKYSASCSMGDVNADGLLDIVVANTAVSWNDKSSLTVPFIYNEHNQLYINKGNNQYVDVSDSSGITDLAGISEDYAFYASVTWAVSMVDYDLDGDVDIIMADDQGFIPDSSQGGLDVGIIHIFNNDGSGHFTDLTVEAGLNIAGSWMGLSFGDLNSDGYMDMFVSNAGDYTPTNFFPYQVGPLASRWFLGKADKSFLDPGVGSLVSSGLGWGTIMSDYDNDGDTDILYHGGFDLGPFVDASNPGLILNNDGKANFKYDFTALEESTNHSRRTVHGFASGDLNDDGFIDLVSVSNFDIQVPLELTEYLQKWDSDLDKNAFYYKSYLPLVIKEPLLAGNEYAWSGNTLKGGSLSVEINSANNENGAVSIDLLGSIDLLPGATVNRDGIGAVVLFTPKDGDTVMRPILGGGSYASQNSLRLHFGLGKESKGDLEVIWPGGKRNIYKNIKAGRHYLVPEIPCYENADSETTEDDSKDRDIENQYKKCVITSLKLLKNEGLIDDKNKSWLTKNILSEYKHSTDIDD